MRLGSRGYKLNESGLPTIEQKNDNRDAETQCCGTKGGEQANMEMSRHEVYSPAIVHEVQQTRQPFHEPRR